MSVSKLSFEAANHVDDAATCGSIKYMQRAFLNWPNATPDHGLHTACCGGWVDLVKWLLQLGANPNIKRNGKSPLYWIIAGDGYAVNDNGRANTPEQYVELLKLMMNYGLVLDKNEIEKAKKEKNSNYVYLKSILEQ